MRAEKWVIGGLLAALCAFAPIVARAEVVNVCNGKAIAQMDMDAYLACVVAAEMPASYEAEALKAQAVAARTRAAFTACASWPGADVCVDSTCCQGYLDEAEQAARWGDDAPLYREKIEGAVRATKGLIMTYDGEPIEVLYHAVSGGHTENAEDVFKTALPYLRGVESPGEEDAARFKTTDVFSQEALSALFPNEAEDGEVRLEVLERSDSGRVMSLRVGRHTMSGRTFRSALGLTSTDFELIPADGFVTIVQHGYGHGVGMSQAGANAMAEAGATFEEILTHYYTGVCITKLEGTSKNF